MEYLFGLVLLLICWRLLSGPRPWLGDERRETLREWERTEEEIENFRQDLDRLKVQAARLAELEARREPAAKKGDDP